MKADYFFYIMKEEFSNTFDGEVPSVVIIHPDDFKDLVKDKSYRNCERICGMKLCKDTRLAIKGIAIFTKCFPEIGTTTLLEEIPKW